MDETFDLHTELEKYGTTFVGLSVEPRSWDSTSADDHGPDISEVLAFFSSRKVIATVGDGHKFGSKYAAVVNLAVFDNGEDDQFTIAVAAADGRITRGQTVQEFVEGMAYSIQTAVIADDFVRFSPHVSAEDSEEDFESPPLNSSAITIVPSPSALTAYRTGIDSPFPIAFGITESHQLIASSLGYSSTPIESDLFDNEFPWVTFAKIGEVRQVSVIADKSLEEVLVLTCAPSYTYPFEPFAGTDSRAVLELLARPIGVYYDESGGPKLSARKKRPSGEVARSIQVITRLCDEADALVDGETSGFFARVGTALQYDPSLLDALAAFELLESTELPRVLGDVPFSEIPVQENLGLLRKIALTSAVESILATGNNHRNSSLPWFAPKQLKPSITVFRALGSVQLLGGLGMLGLCVMSSVERELIFGIVAAMFTLALISTAVSSFGIAQQFARAQGLVNKARNEGVVPANLRNT